MQSIWVNRLVPFCGLLPLVAGCAKQLSQDPAQVLAGIVFHDPWARILGLVEIALGLSLICLPHLRRVRSSGAAFYLFMAILLTVVRFFGVTDCGCVAGLSTHISAILTADLLQFVLLLGSLRFEKTEPFFCPRFEESLANGFAFWFGFAYLTCLVVGIDLQTLINMPRFSVHLSEHNRTVQLASSETNAVALPIRFANFGSQSTAILGGKAKCTSGLLSFPIDVPPFSSVDGWVTLEDLPKTGIKTYQLTFYDSYGRVSQLVVTVVASLDIKLGKS